MCCCCWVAEDDESRDDPHNVMPMLLVATLVDDPLKLLDDAILRVALANLLAACTMFSIYTLCSSRKLIVVVVLSLRDNR